MTDLTVAQTILAQLGGSRFTAMTGAKDFVGSDVALNFRFPKAKDGINRARVVLNPGDTYDVVFYRQRGTKLAMTDCICGVYADQLQETFTRYTGLDTHL